MTKEFKIEHNIEHDCVYSNLVYPLGFGYYLDAQLDNEWVEDKLTMWFQKRNLRIANKYVVEVGLNSGNTMLIYNHDGKHYLIQKEIA
jgi:hypothetical protein